MSWVAGLLAAMVPLLIAFGQYINRFSPVWRMQKLLELRSGVSEDSLARVSLDEAIDRCAAKMSHAERVTGRRFSLYLGTGGAIVGFIFLLFAFAMAKSFPKDSVEQLLWTFGALAAYIIAVLGVFALIAGHTYSTVELSSLRRADVSEIEEKYGLARRIRMASFRHRKKKRLQRRRNIVFRRALRARKLASR